MSFSSQIMTFKIKYNVALLNVNLKLMEGIKPLKLNELGHMATGEVLPVCFEKLANKDRNLQPSNQTISKQSCY